jgi:hypothetical protein
VYPDTDSLNPDPDTELNPVFQVNPDTDPDSDPIRIQSFDNQKLKKKNCNLLTSKLQEKPSALKRTSSGSKNEIY